LSCACLSSWHEVASGIGRCHARYVKTGFCARYVVCDSSNGIGPRLALSGQGVGVMSSRRGSMLVSGWHFGGVICLLLTQTEC